MIRVAVAGAAGRTGRCVAERALDDERFEVTSALSTPDCPSLGSVLRSGNCEVVVKNELDAPCDVLIDFTVAAGTITWLKVCKEEGIPMVIGATGHNQQQQLAIQEAVQTIPILKAANFSIGLQAILGVVGRLAAELGETYDIEIVEGHHRHKVDAPSGTALALFDQIAATTGRVREEDAIFGRHGQSGERPRKQIGIHALRMGESVGWHEIHFGGPAESITIRHTAHARDAFAVGALRAAAWLIGRPEGLYSMGDVVA